MADMSNLDEKYFIDESVYNCPFCNRRHVSYKVVGRFKFDWTQEKPCNGFLVKCDSCANISMHLSFEPIHVRSWTQTNSGNWTRFAGIGDEEPPCDYDAAFFYSVPTSFFVLDNRVPKILRELLTEAEGSLKSNFLTGASACARKMIYELGVLSKAEGDNYEDRIKSLKGVHQEVDPSYFDTLLTIQQMTSTKVHEGSYDGWEAKHLRVILASLREILHEIYVVPAQKSDRRKAILELKEELIPSGKVKEAK
ncbi:MAG: hypothetical protein ACTHLR_17360 [Rhizomicrobium sp.]